jgi:hypothetical protein
VIEIIRLREFIFRLVLDFKSKKKSGFFPFERFSRKKSKPCWRKRAQVRKKFKALFEKRAQVRKKIQSLVREKGASQKKIQSLV